MGAPDSRCCEARVRVSSQGRSTTLAKPTFEILQFAHRTPRVAERVPESFKIYFVLRFLH
jgi:hypothetical protein